MVSQNNQNGDVSEQITNGLGRPELPAEIAAQLVRCRQEVLRKASKRKSKIRQTWIPNWQLAMPAALVVVFSLYMGMPDKSTMPLLPMDMAEGGMPSEDLALLEDLEFVDWLAEQENVGQ